MVRAGRIKAPKKRLTERLIRIHSTNHTLIRPVKSKEVKDARNLGRGPLTGDVMVDDTQFVAIRVAEIGAVIVGMILRPETWRAFVCAAMRKSIGVRFVNNAAACGLE